MSVKSESGGSAVSSLFHKSSGSFTKFYKVSLKWPVFVFLTRTETSSVRPSVRSSVRPFSGSMLWRQKPQVQLEPREPGVPPPPPPAPPGGIPEADDSRAASSGIFPPSPTISQKLSSGSGLWKTPVNIWTTLTSGVRQEEAAAPQEWDQAWANFVTRGPQLS